MANKTSIEVVQQPVWRFLARLRGMNVMVRSEQGRLRVSGPTGTLTPELRLELTERKAEILNFLRDSSLAIVRPPIERVSRDQPLPLSFAQERLWRNERNAASPENINVMFFDLKGDLDSDALERSFQELVRRHEVFRTTFHLVWDTPVQRIAVDQSVSLNRVDLSQAPDAEAESARWAFKEKADPISLEHGPLMRFSLLRLGPHHHRLVMTLHHILFDRWSLPIFRRELDALYTAFCLGKESPLAEPTVQLADFAVWQRKNFAPGTKAFEAQLAYWKKQLSGTLPVLRLPCERSSELTTASLEGVLAPLKMPEELSAELRTLARRERTTLFVIFLAALKAVINLSTGQNDLMIGTYMAKRSAPECEGMMGCFSDVGILRTTVSSDLSFLALASRVRETVLNAHSHDDIPFESLTEELRKGGLAAPDLRAIFTFEALSEARARFGDLQVRNVASVIQNTMPWRFQMRVRDEGKAFSGLVRFDARLHDPPLVRRMVRSYIRLLEAVVRKPAARLCDLEEELGGR